MTRAGQAGARTDLDEGADTGGVHRFDFGDKLDRPGQLVGQQFLGRSLLGRIVGGSGVGVDRDAAR